MPHYPQRDSTSDITLCTLLEREYHYFGRFSGFARVRENFHELVTGFLARKD